MMKLAERKRPPVPPDLGSTPGGNSPAAGDLMQLMQRCWTHEPRLRPGFDEIVNTLRHLLVRPSTRKPQLWCLAPSAGCWPCRVQELTGATCQGS